MLLSSRLTQGRDCMLLILCWLCTHNPSTFLRNYAQFHAAKRPHSIALPDHVPLIFC
jgi:hypothetical protein